MTNLHMKPDAGQLKVTGHDAKLIYTVITKAVRKNWWVIALYAFINIAGVICAYFFTAPLLSAAASLFVAGASTYVGYYMMSQVITITNEVR